MTSSLAKLTDEEREAMMHLIGLAVRKVACGQDPTEEELNRYQLSPALKKDLAYAKEHDLMPGALFKDRDIP